MSNHRLLKALHHQPVDRTPAWIMRQAGRYLPEYRKVRSSVKDFLTLCKTPELAAKVTLQPLERFDLDAAIIFSDILTIPDAFGLELYFEENHGPKFNKPIRFEQDIYALPKIDPETELKYVMDAIRLTKQSLQGKAPIIGFSGSPWTIASYMVEGQSPKQFNIIKRFLYQSPKLLHALLKHLTETIIEYLKAQISAGADVVMLFDTWGGVLSKEHYVTFSLNYMQAIIQALKSYSDQKTNQKIPVILFTKNGGPYLDKILSAGPDAIGLDWTMNLKEARKIVGKNAALQGNLDPACLYADEQTIEKAVIETLEQYGNGSGHIFNLGHGILPDVDPEKLAYMLNVLHRESPKYHKLDVIHDENPKLQGERA